MVHRLDARIEHENGDGDANADRKASQEILNPCLCCTGADGRRSHSRLVDTHRGLRELFGDIHFLQTGKNRIVEGLIGLLLTLDIIILNRFCRYLKKAALRFFPCNFSFICLNLESILGGLEKIHSVIENATQIRLCEIDLCFDRNVGGVFCAVALGEQGQFALACIERLGILGDFRLSGNAWQEQ